MYGSDTNVQQSLSSSLCTITHRRAASQRAAAAKRYTVTRCRRGTLRTPLADTHTIARMRSVRGCVDAKHLHNGARAGCGERGEQAYGTHARVSERAHRRAERQGTHQAHRITDRQSRQRALRSANSGGWGLHQADSLAPVLLAPLRTMTTTASSGWLARNCSPMGAALKERDIRLVTQQRRERDGLQYLAGSHHLGSAADTADHDERASRDLQRFETMTEPNQRSIR